MSKHLTTDDLKNRKTALALARQEDFPTEEGGNHTLVKYEGIVCPLHRHNCDFKPGTRHAIQKSFARMLAIKAAKAAGVIGAVVLLAIYILPLIAS